MLRAFCVRLHNSPAYCTVVELSRVVRIGMPESPAVQVKRRLCRQASDASILLAVEGGADGNA